MPAPVIKNKYEADVLKVVVEDARVKHKDYFWAKYIYMMTHEWFIERNYGPRSDSKWPEKLYLHRYQQKGGEEVWIWWRFRKQFSNVLRYDLDVDWHIIGLEDADIVKDGKKYKANKGECEFKIYARIIFDQGPKWRKHPILGKLYKTFYTSIYYKDLLAHRKQLYHDLYEFKQAIKTYFNLQNYLPMPEGTKFFADENMNTPFYDPGERK